MAFEFKLKQDGKIVARGYTPDKIQCLSTAGRYFSSYSEEEFTKFTLEVINKGDNNDKKANK